MPDIVIRTEKLSKSYNGVDALKALDLEVPEHSIVGFLGPNGAGKSTTIKLLLGLIYPTSGSGSIFGKDIVQESREIRRRVGYLAQHPQFDGALTARETLRFVARFFYAGPKEAIEARVQESLELVNLSNKADRPIKGFSGGEMQRLGIAQAQINHPDLLILDEPAAALDPMGRRDVLQIMERLREHATIFYSTHILDDVQRVSDRVVILNHGELVAQGPIEALLRADEGCVYRLSLKGLTDETQSRIAQQPWVSSLHASHINGVTRWRVTVSDEETAEMQLLRLVLADETVRVMEFGPEKYELEDVFMQLIVS